MKAYALTDIGKMRKVNQDAQFASTEPVGELSNLFVVADGMGGHQAGDFASRYLIEHMPEYIKESGENEPVAALRKGWKLRPFGPELSCQIMLNGGCALFNL